MSGAALLVLSGCGTSHGPPTGDDVGSECDLDPRAPGCPCAGAGTLACYPGPDGTLGLGICGAGVQSCSDGRWSVCAGAVLPATETCNGVDDDCDGDRDDGVTNECGTCGECGRTCVGRGEGCEPWDVEAEGGGVAECRDGSGCIQPWPTDWPWDAAWLPNTPEGTISRVDIETHAEVARYLTSPSGVSDVPSPSRTTASVDGSVVVANRAFGAQPSVTRIDYDCEDRNGDGRVETSAGPGDVLAWGEDECVAWHAEVGAVGGIARGLASGWVFGLDGETPELVWVGLFAERRYVELDRTDGAATGREWDVSPCTPYAAAFGPDGDLWSSCLSDSLFRIDLEGGDVEYFTQPAANYGIAVDDEGRVWTGGTCTRYTPWDDAFDLVPGCTGTSLASDLQDYVWMGSCSIDGGPAGTCRIDVDSLEARWIDARSHGVSVDRHGTIWGIPAGDGFVDLVEPGLDVVRILDDCGGPCLAGTYTYGDLTPWGWRSATPGTGEYSHVFEGCDDGTQWQVAEWEADAGGGRIVWALRTADDLETLAGRPWTDLAEVPNDESPFPLELALRTAGSGRYLELRVFVFTLDRDRPPRVFRMGVQYNCEP